MIDYLTGHYMDRVYRAFCESHAAFDFPFPRLYKYACAEQYMGIYINLTMI